MVERKLRDARLAKEMSDRMLLTSDPAASLAKKR